MKFEYVGIFMPKMKGLNYEKENNMYGNGSNNATYNNRVSGTLADESKSAYIR